MEKTIKDNYLEKCVNKKVGKDWLGRYELPLDIIIELAKKEVFDDIESLSIDHFGIDSNDYFKLKKKHLGG